MSCPYLSSALILVDHGVERAFDGLGLGLRSQQLLCFLELGLVEDQVLVPALACCTVNIAHVMYMILPRMYIGNNISRRARPLLKALKHVHTHSVAF
jgi:hypothetical protein